MGIRLESQDQLELYFDANDEPRTGKTCPVVLVQVACHQVRVLTMSKNALPIPLDS
jgi:hypothetical protein